MAVPGETDLITVDEFERELDRLLETSARNGIAFDRSWTFRRPGSDVPDLMVEISYLHDRSDDS